MEDLFLKTNFGLDQKIPIALKVLGEEPDWNGNAAAFDYNMSIIGNVCFDGVLSTDTYDKVVAFYNDEVRGVANLFYDSDYQDYFAFLTLYSNQVSGNP